MTKSYVSMEQRVCPVCGITHSHDCGILLDRRLKDSMESKTTTGFGMCEEHDKQSKEGYIHLVVIDPDKSDAQGKERVKPEDAYRTGRICSIRKEAFAKIFNVKDSSPIMFIDNQVADYLESLQSQPE